MSAMRLVPRNNMNRLRGPTSSPNTSGVGKNQIRGNGVQNATTPRSSYIHPDDRREQQQPEKLDPSEYQGLSYIIQINERALYVGVMNSRLNKQQRTNMRSALNEIISGTEQTDKKGHFTWLSHFRDEDGKKGVMRVIASSDDQGNLLKIKAFDSRLDQKNITEDDMLIPETRFSPHWSGKVSTDEIFSKYTTEKENPYFSNGKVKSTGVVHFSVENKNKDMRQIANFVGNLKLDDILKNVGYVKVGLGSLESGSASEWDPQSQSITLDNTHPAVIDKGLKHLAGLAVIEILRAASQHQRASIDQQARSGKFELLAENTSYSAAELYSQAVNHLEFNNRQLHHQTMKDAGHEGSAADLFRTGFREFKDFWLWESKNDNAHDLLKQYNGLRPEQAVTIESDKT